MGDNLINWLTVTLITDYSSVPDKFTMNITLHSPPGVADCPVKTFKWQKQTLHSFPFCTQYKKMCVNPVICLIIRGLIMPTTSFTDLHIHSTHFWLVVAEKGTGVTNNISPDSVTVRQHAQYQDPDTEAVTCNSSVILFSTPVCFILLWQH